MKTRIPLLILELTPEEQKEQEKSWMKYNNDRREIEESRNLFPTFESQQPYHDLEQATTVTLRKRDFLYVCLVFCLAWLMLVLAFGGL